MAAAKQLKANELVLILAGLLGFDVEILAQVGNLPRRNLKSWLSGKKDNLRIQSIVHLLSLLGLQVGSAGPVRLDDKRVHFWSITESLFSSKRATYAPLAALSRLMTGCAITEVRPEKRTLFGSLRRRYYLVCGKGVRVVICVKKGFFSRPPITPDLIKGACWRDESEKHLIVAPQQLWSHLIERDLTIYEFDRIWNETREMVTWHDVSLMAREVGATPADIKEWIAEKYGGPVPAESSAEEYDAGIDIDDGNGRIRLLTSRRAA